MIAPRDDIGKLRAIGRPVKIAGLTFRVDELRCLGSAGKGDRPNLIFAEEGDTITGGGGSRCVTSGDFFWRAGERSDPNGLLDTLRKAGGVRIIAAIFEIATADEDD